jgi:hypothetical protein
MSAEIKAASWIAAREAMGVYCKSWPGKDGQRIERGPYHEGWNAYGSKLLERGYKVEAFLSSLPKDQGRLIANMLLEHDLELYFGKDDQIHLSVNCNDLFYWACADSEDINIDEIPSLVAAIQEHESLGALKWCCLHRKQQPQAPIIKEFKEAGIWSEELEALPKDSDDWFKKNEESTAL